MNNKRGRKLHRRYKRKLYIHLDFFGTSNVVGPNADVPIPWERIKGYNGNFKWDVSKVYVPEPGIYAVSWQVPFNWPPIQNDIDRVVWAEYDGERFAEKGIKLPWRFWYPASGEGIIVIPDVSKPIEIKARHDASSSISLWSANLGNLNQWHGYLTIVKFSDL